MTDPEKLRREYPEIISSEQLRLILHVSKRRCVWLMKNYIPHTDNGSKTRRYTIRLDDAIAFLLALERSPESFEAPVGQFNSKPFTMPSVDPESLRLVLEDEWCSIHDILDPVTVSSLTCYSDTSVNRWLDKGILRSALAQNGRVTSKAWLIDFFCGNGMRIAKKNEWHRELLRSAVYE